MMGWRLVSPNGEIHHVADERALGQLCQRHGLRTNNMRHLVGLFHGNSAVPEHVKGWRLMEAVKYIRHQTTGEVLPVLGTLENFEKWSMGRSDLCFAHQRLRKV